MEISLISHTCSATPSTSRRWLMGTFHLRLSNTLQKRFERPLYIFSPSRRRSIWVDTNSVPSILHCGPYSTTSCTCLRTEDHWFERKTLLNTLTKPWRISKTEKNKTVWFTTVRVFLKFLCWLWASIIEKSIRYVMRYHA